MTQLFYAFSIAAIFVMVFALFRVSALNKKIRGGTVGTTWRFLTLLIGIFTLGYLTAPFFLWLPDDYKQLIVGAIFLFGAIFVVIVINLFLKVMKELGLAE